MGDQVYRGSVYTQQPVSPAKMISLVPVLFCAAVVLPSVLAEGYGHGGGDSHSSHGQGTACIVKGSYCQCHYCKCEHGHLHCKGYGHGGGGYGKKYCYGSMEGEYCHCDCCKCKHGFGQDGYGKGCGHHKK